MAERACAKRLPYFEDLPYLRLLLNDIATYCLFPKLKLLLTLSKKSLRLHFDLKALASSLVNRLIKSIEVA